MGNIFQLYRISRVALDNVEIISILVNICARTMRSGRGYAPRTLATRYAASRRGLRIARVHTATRSGPAGVPGGYRNTASARAPRGATRGWGQRPSSPQASQQRAGRTATAIR